MIIKKWVEHSQEIEIGLTVEDIRVIITEPDADYHDILTQLNSIAAFMKAVPDETIEKMSAGVLSAIINFLTEQTTRYCKKGASDDEGKRNGE